MTSLFLKDTLFVKLHDSFVFCVLIPRTQKIFTNYSLFKSLMILDFDIKLVFWIFVAHTKTIREGH